MSSPRRVTAPASKSLSHRYCIGAALAAGESRLRHVLESRDTQCTRAILSAAGAAFHAEGRSDYGDAADWRVCGMADGLPRGGASDAPLSCDVHESGTTCRLLTAVLAAGKGCFRIHGAPRMHERPIAELTDALAPLGPRINFEGKPGCPPLLLETEGLDAAAVNGLVPLGMDHSSQYFSGLLLAAPLAGAVHGGPLTVALTGSKAVSWPYVGLTLQCLRDFGIRFIVEVLDDAECWQLLPGDAWRQLDAAEPGRLRVTVQPGRYQPGDHSVEGDWSGASYLLGAGALGAAPVRVEGLRADSLQGDRAMLAILRDMGARLSIDVGAVTVEPSALRGIDVDMGACPDLVPTVAVLAAAAHGTTRIRNVAHLRIKESDRITAPAQELARVGVRVDPQEDGLVVHGLGADVLAANVRALSPDACFQAHNDHRIAMSLALLSLLPGVSLSLEDRIDDPRVVAKSFPHFWRLWEALR